MKKKIIFYTSIIGAIAISNLMLNIHTSKVADIALINTEANASEREAVVLKKNHTMYTSVTCTIHFDGKEYEGTYVYCHEMPNSFCSEGCAL